jgi:hypothetical protein
MNREPGKRSDQIVEVVTGQSKRLRKTWKAPYVIVGTMDDVEFNFGNGPDGFPLAGNTAVS